MVSLKQLYSNTNLFNKIEFKRGINIISGFYSNKEEDNISLNGIGKSTPIRLIDYMFASASGKAFFDTSENEFLKGESVFLDLEIHQEIYTIKRNFDEKEKIYFGKRGQDLIEYGDDEFRKILGRLFFNEEGDDIYFENKRFRDLIRFYIKDDVDNFERQEALSFISNHTKKFDTYSLNLYLMGIKNEALYKYSVIKEKCTDLNAQRKKQIDMLKEETGKAFEEASSEILKMQNRINLFEKSLEDYEFMESYEEIERDLIEVSKKISDFLSKHNTLIKKLNEYKSSYELNIEIDVDEISKQYSEIKEIFGEIVKKQLSEVIEFRKNLSENRKIFLKKREVELEYRIEKIKSEINSLENQRKKMFKRLEEKKALDGLKNTYSTLIEEKAKKERLETLVKNINNLDDELYIENENLAKEIKKIKIQIDSCKNKELELSKLFFEITEKVLGKKVSEGATFSIIPSPKKNSPLSINLEVPKSKSLGKKRFKVLVYELTIFLNSILNKMDMPKFLFHDGIFHSIDIKTISNILNYVNNFSLENNFQYIITANEGDLHMGDEESLAKYTFNIKDKIIAKYSDKPEEMFFKKEFD